MRRDFAKLFSDDVGQIVFLLLTDADDDDMGDEPAVIFYYTHAGTTYYANAEVAEGGSPEEFFDDLNENLALEMLRDIRGWRGAELN